MLDIQNQSGNTNYNLKAVVEHTGLNFKSGHYKAFIHQEEWIEADDLCAKVNTIFKYILII